ncbi:hypothetical protein HCUR_00086 [Holospora curviuscula]|uniref:Transposase DDE domain-containing protein n=1 Tax=Holospora curviuscula TaxID=1082868 RepID=A0A2S5RHU6_9PROT|nr:hypothetical protein HCUR_00086 [Holospora curviuscula]
MLIKRWVIERTLAWLNHYPRSSKEYEITVAAAESRVMIAYSMLLLRRIVHPSIQAPNRKSKIYTLDLDRD